MRRASLLCAIAATGLASCGSVAVTRAPVPDDPLAPPPSLAEGGVDPMIVGDRLMAAGQPELALDAYTRAAGRHGLTPEVLHALGAANLALGRAGQGERLLREAWAMRPEEASILNDLGVAVMRRGETGEARRLFRAAFALRPESDAARENLRLAEAASMPSETEPRADGFTITDLGGGVFALDPPG